MNGNILREITPTEKHDFFAIKNHPNAVFNFPTHFHFEFELNMIANFEGKRIVGDSIEVVNGDELVLIGPNTYHSWHGDADFRTHIITIQFSPALFETAFLDRNLFKPIKDLLEFSPRGIVFSKETRDVVKPMIYGLVDKRDFGAVIDFLSILHQLSQAKDFRLLAGPNFAHNPNDIKSRRVLRVYEYIHKNYGKKISVKEVADLISMTESGFCHFFKKRVGKSFIEYLNDVRVGNAARMLAQTNHTISEISYVCGFATISNFNRLFKKKKGLTPSEFRTNSGETTTVF